MCSRVESPLKFLAHTFPIPSSAEGAFEAVEEQVSSHGRGPEDGPVADGGAEVKASASAAVATEEKIRSGQIHALNNNKS